MEIFVGDLVKKKSDRPFKSGLKKDYVSALGVNLKCPKNSPAVQLKTCGTWVNIKRILKF